MIDLDRVAGNGHVHNLAGKPRGEAARKELKIDELDESSEPVVVKVPEHIYAISSSYFLGLFSRSVARYGSAERFLSRYQFDADATIMKHVLHGIDRCLSRSDSDQSLPRS